MRAALDGQTRVFERVIPCRNGVRRHSLARYTPEFVGGVVTGFFVEVGDVSVMKSAEAELLARLEALERRSEIDARRLLRNTLDRDAAVRAALEEASRQAAKDVGGVLDMEARYQATLTLVKGDTAQGVQLKVTGTPTFFMNGMRLPGLRPEFFDAAIAWELNRVGGGGQ